MVLGTDKSMLACTVLLAWGNGGWVLERSKIPWCLSFFFSFIFSSGGHLVQQSRTV